MEKKKKRKIVIAITIIVLTLIALSIIYFNYDGDSTSLNVITMSISLIPENVVLDFCSYEQGCIDYFKENGMPDGFLEQKGYQIICQNGNCYITQ